MAPTQEHYQVLGVTRNSTPDEITKAFRRLVLIHQPDKKPGCKEYEERTKQVRPHTLPLLQSKLTTQINNAYEVLADPQLRA